MLDIKFIRENLKEVKEMLEKRHFKIEVERLLSLGAKKTSFLQKIELLRAERNKVSKKPTSENKKRGKEIKSELKILEPQLKNIAQDLQTTLWELPNMVHPDAPVGKDESENVVVRQWKEPIKFDFEPLDHLEIGKNLDLIDFERGAKVSGSQFYYFKNDAVLLSFSLMRFALDCLSKKGFVLIKPPELVKTGVLDGTGYNPRGSETQLYKIENQDLGLIATSEIAVAGYLMDEIIFEKDLPLKFAGYSHCFRTEAGGYGRYSKGLYRIHEFSKAEMFIFCLPSQSEKMHQLLLETEEEIFQQLEIPYRVVEMCSGDLGAAAYRKFDLEAWMPSRPPAGGWGEVTSTSNCTAYQSRRLNIKYRKKDGQLDYLHTLNGTAIADSRTIIAILENFQQKDGSVIVPEVLRKYLGKGKITGLV
ncbi:serine--tRNA ligase [Candidatus Microgenomates bacterium]|nr:serine--tRNA ligase [Candidatus Microgenomates bacterium]